MTDERPLIEGIEAYHESLKEGARRERERILKVIDEYIADLKDGKEWGSAIPVITLEALKEQLKR